MKEIYLCADGSDSKHEQKMREGLGPILKRFDLSLWGTRDILPGTNRLDEVKSHLANAAFFIPLVSSSSLASNECLKEVLAAKYRAQHEQLKIIPILIRPCMFEFSELAGFPCLPRDGKSITEKPDSDKAWLEVFRDLLQIITESQRYLQAGED